MKKVFISHPYAENPRINSKRVDDICGELLDNHINILPISPLHMFSYFKEDESNYREEIMKMCLHLINNCDEVYMYLYDELSKGQKRELEYATNLDKNIKIIVKGVNEDV